MVKAKDLVGKTYTDAYSSLGLESYLDSKTGHHLIRDVPEAETVLGIYEAFQPEYNTPTLTHKYSRLKTLAECISDKFNNFRHSKTAAVLAAGSIVTAGAISAIAKDLMPHHPGIIMDATAQDTSDESRALKLYASQHSNPNSDTDTHNLGYVSVEVTDVNGYPLHLEDLALEIKSDEKTIWAEKTSTNGVRMNGIHSGNQGGEIYSIYENGEAQYDADVNEISTPVEISPADHKSVYIKGNEFGTIQNAYATILDNNQNWLLDTTDTILIFNSNDGDLVKDLPSSYELIIKQDGVVIGGVTSDNTPIGTTDYDLMANFGPELLFSRGEKYFPTQVHYDDESSTIDNYKNWKSEIWVENDENKVVYTTVTDYSYKTSPVHPEGYKVVQYWMYYVYNDWGFDQHEYDWEAIHKWVDNKNGEVFYTSASMHLWDNEYEKNVNRFLVEEGGHGMTADGSLAGDIQIITSGTAYGASWYMNYGSAPMSDLDPYYEQRYQLSPFRDWDKYDDDSGFPGERGKFPTDQERFKDPDKAIRLSNSLETIVREFKIKNSPELLVIADGRATGLRDGRVIEDIPMSNYIENEERIIIIGDHKDIEVVLTGTENEKYELEGRTYNNGVEKTFTNKGTIRDNEIKKLDVTDTETPSADNESPNYTQLMVAAAIGGGALPILYLVRNKKSEKVDSSNKPKPEVINSNLKTTQISDLMNKHKKSKDAKTKRTNLPEECLEEEGQRKAISFADFSDE